MKCKKLSDVSIILNGTRLDRFNTCNTKKQLVIKKIYPNNKWDHELKEISEDLDLKFYTKINDILINITKPYTVIKVNKEGYIIPMNYIIVRVKSDYDVDYIYQILKNRILSKKFNHFIEGSVLKTIKLGYLKEINIPIIDSKKQKKIIKLLDLFEKRGNLLQKSIELTKALEKGIFDNFLNY